MGMVQMNGKWSLVEATVPASACKSLVSGSAPEIRDALRTRFTRTFGSVNHRARVVRVPL